MPILAAALGLFLILVILWDAFETIVLPRRVTGRIRLARSFFRSIWLLWRGVARRMSDPRAREAYLSYYGPLFLILLLVTWAAGMVLGFALLQWAGRSRVAAPEAMSTFWTDLYFSGTTFFTLGLGDVVPNSVFARVLTMIEGGMGLGFLALVISYLPVLYQSFSRREVPISMLDERAGSPPSAGEMLRRYGEGRNLPGIATFLEEWEKWSSELMESHLSYPILAYYRSQHENESWLATLTMVLDACALVIVGVEGVPAHSAQFTFAMARHCAGDISQVLLTPPKPPPENRLSPEELRRLRAVLAAAGVPVREGEEADRALTELRAQYEPYVYALADRLLMPLPRWLPEGEGKDNWQTTAWEMMEGRSIPRSDVPGP